MEQDRVTGALSLLWLSFALASQSFSSQPADVTVSLGSEVTLPCVVVGRRGDVQVSVTCHACHVSRDTSNSRVYTKHPGTSELFLGKALFARTAQEPMQLQWEGSTIQPTLCMLYLHTVLSSALCDTFRGHSLCL